jgi:hypothetical protein
LVIANPIYQKLFHACWQAARKTHTLNPTNLAHPKANSTRSSYLPFLHSGDNTDNHLLRSAAYHEISPHLVMMAFLDRGQMVAMLARICDWQR